MARLEKMPESMRARLMELACPTFAERPWAEGPPLRERRIAIISSAGLQRRGDRPFDVGAADYRILRGDGSANDVVMSHISTNYDRTGFQQDLNVVYPIDRLREMAADGEIGSVADYHYSFMGATDPTAMEPFAREVAGLLRDDKVDGVLLVPV